MKYGRKIYGYYSARAGLKYGCPHSRKSSNWVLKKSLHKAIEFVNPENVPAKNVLLATTGSLLSFTCGALIFQIYLLSKENKLTEPQADTLLVHPDEKGRESDFSGLLGLQESGSDQTYKNKFGFNELHIAAMLKMPKTLQLYLERGAKIEAYDKHSHPPIYHSLHKEGTMCLETMLKYGAKANYVEQHSGKDLLQLAIDRGNSEAAKLIIPHADIANVCRSGTNALYNAVEKNMLEIAAELIERGADVNQQSSHVKLSPLHIAANDGNERMIELLTKDFSKVNPWLRDVAGHLPIDLAKKPQFHREYNPNAVSLLERIYKEADEYIWELTENQDTLFAEENLVDIQCAGAEVTT